MLRQGKKKGGRKPKYGERSARKFVRESLKDRFKTARDLANDEDLNKRNAHETTISKILRTQGNLHARLAIKSHKISKENMRKRYEWAKLL